MVDQQKRALIKQEVSELCKVYKVTKLQGYLHIHVEHNSRRIHVFPLQYRWSNPDELEHGTYTSLTQFLKQFFYDKK